MNMLRNVLLKGILVAVLFCGISCSKPTSNPSSFTEELPVVSSEGEVVLLEDGLSSQPFDSQEIVDEAMQYLPQNESSDLSSQAYWRPGSLIIRNFWDDRSLRQKAKEVTYNTIDASNARIDDHGRIVVGSLVEKGLDLSGINHDSRILVYRFQNGRWRMHDVISKETQVYNPAPNDVPKYVFNKQVNKFWYYMISWKITDVDVQSARIAIDQYDRFAYWGPSKQEDEIVLTQTYSYNFGSLSGDLWDENRVGGYGAVGSDASYVYVNDAAFYNDSTSFDRYQRNYVDFEAKSADGSLIAATHAVIVARIPEGEHGLSVELSEYRAGEWGYFYRDVFSVQAQESYLQFFNANDRIVSVGGSDEFRTFIVPLAPTSNRLSAPSKGFSRINIELRGQGTAIKQVSFYKLP